MTIEELKSNVKKTRKIIDYGINSDLGRDYVVRVYQLDWDWDKTPKILSVMFIIEISAEGYSNMEVNEINTFLTKQEQSIYKILDNQKSTIGSNLQSSSSVG